MLLSALMPRTRVSERIRCQIPSYCKPLRLATRWRIPEQMLMSGCETVFRSILDGMQPIIFLLIAREALKLGGLVA